MRPSRRQLALAVAALLGTDGTCVAADATPGTDEQLTQVDSGLLWYQENDHRIKDVEAIVSLRQPLEDDRAWGAHLTFDTVCGGSPIGALPSKSTQSFFTPTATSLTAPPAVTQTTTSASGGGGGGLAGLSLCSNPVQNAHFTTAPGQLPIDRSFHDERFAFSGNYETPVVDTFTKLTGGLAVSHETDFFSLSANAALARDIFSRNTTLSVGVNLESDLINPVGGTPDPGSAYGLFEKSGNRNKRAGTGVLGITQVMTRRWLTQGTLTGEIANGYQTDPYKIVSLLDAQGYASSNPLDDYVYERRPESRNRWGLYWDNRYAFDHDVAQLSLRYTQDTWGVRSETAEAHYRFTMGMHGYLEPHLRAYHQTAANFFNFYLDAGAPLPAYFSADPRLAAFTARTVGLKYGVPMDGSGGEFSLRVERYLQTGSGPGSVPVGLQGLDLYPGMSAWIVQLGARFTF